MDFTFDNVEITGGFWADMQKKNREVTVPAVYDRFYETGRVEALACRWKDGEPHRPHIFWDSDIAKWVESAAYVLAKYPDPELESKVEDIIDEIAANQWEDGYINSYYTSIEPENRFTNRTNHELYCAGHLMEAAVAYYCATGHDRLLKCVDKYADLIDRVFRVERSAAFSTPGHEEIELALVRMYNCTGDEKYLRLAEFFIDTRGTDASEAQYEWVYPNYSQSEKPVREMDSAFGHAVRAGYLYTGMADVASLTGDEALSAACRRLYDDIVERKMYVTGGIGSTHSGEAFTVSYDLPNETAYAETCAAISLMFFAQRLLESEGESRYADTVERILFNGFLSGVSLSGDAFFYENPLSVHVRNRIKNTSTKYPERFPATERQKVFDCSCCPPNVTRVLASLERYVCRSCGDTVMIDQYMNATVRGDGFTVSVATDYPSSGEIRISCRGVKRIGLRIPGWCREFTLSAPYRTENGYAVVEDPGELTLSLSMEPVVMLANPEVTDCAGCCAVQRGPVVYAYEGVDNGGHAPERFLISPVLNADTESDSFCGLPTLTVDGEFIPDADYLYKAYFDD
ncbi:MAG: glycoside hydrolase family 127 protein, partial [Clostridia bacterium]|nr:glycoside hydrolase family 127 protein [Clostridia bacterium]